jgi:NosR/NirI family nitrous oxide reductase transcriptional regulator
LAAGTDSAARFVAQLENLIGGANPRVRRSRALAVLSGVLLCFTSAAFAQPAARLPQFLSQIQAADVFPGAERLGPAEGTPPAAAAYKGDRLAGYVYLNSDVVSSNGYSGKPIDIVIGIDLKGEIVGAKLVEHHEPIVLVGVPVAKIEKVIHDFVGRNFLQNPPAAEANPKVNIVSGATVTSMVIADSITRSSLRFARARGLGGAQAEAAAAQPTATRKIDETKEEVEDWEQLLSDGSVRRLLLTVDEVNEAFAKSGNAFAAEHPEETEDEADSDDHTFIDLYLALASVPSIGRSLLGDTGYGQLKDSLKPGQQAIIVAGNGRYSFKGSGYVRGGIFDRIELVQGDDIFRFRDRDHHRLGDLAGGAPYFKEIALFTVPPGQSLDPTQPFALKLLAQRAVGAREKAFLTFNLDYALPDKYMIAGTPAATAPPAGAAATGATAAEPEQEPLWMRIWRGKIVDIAILATAILALTGIFFFQDFLVRRPVLYDRVRLVFLAFTLFWIGWYAQAQLSVVNVLTFVSALRGDFRWDYFLVDPLIFMLWCAVAAAMLFWGRGAYCGWLCPFGALQELMNRAAKLVRIPQIRVPFGLHQRLWPVKYIIFLVLFALSLYSLSLGEEASEVEPFKTAIVLRFAREWPFVLFAAGLLGAGLFIERFFCRYLCPLGAALAIPARVRMFDWLKRYRECGNPCQRCANQCPVQSIHPEGHINPNECIQCMHCQMLYHHAYKCPVVIQRRLKAEKRAAGTSPTIAAAAGKMSAAAQISRMVHGSPSQNAKGDQIS